ncbi:MAG: hypothetical protein PVI26_12550 [Chitinispirillia bacterium]|jgi:hypothetical protein
MNNNQNQDNVGWGDFNDTDDKGAQNRPVVKPVKLKERTKPQRRKKQIAIGKIVLIIVIVLLIVAGLGGGGYFLFFMKDLSNQVVLPYIAHQKPRIDPHVPASVPIADKLDEVIFDGLFNISANPSGITYEDGLGELTGIDENNIISVRLKPRAKWHSSYSAKMEKKKVALIENEGVYFTAKDLTFTLRRIQNLGSLSPDYILVYQALKNFDFTGPDNNDEIRFKFRDDRIWTETDIKEVLSFKILPHTSEMNAPMYREGSGPYLLVGQKEDLIYFHRNPSVKSFLRETILKPYIDNSTYTTELKNGNINTILSTPFGSISPILSDTSDYFYKSNISTCFFALLFNTKRLNLEKRIALRSLIDNKKILTRFFKINTEQQRHIADYKGNQDNYQDYLNYSIFPSSSYYIDEKIVTPLLDKGRPDLSVLNDTVYIQTCLNFGFREELSELVEILNDPSVSGGKLKVSAVQNSDIKLGNYDAVLVPVSGYRSNFLFDLYDIFLREPDFALHKIHLKTSTNKKGELEITRNSFQEDKNFFRLDFAHGDENGQKAKLLEYVYGFMSSSEVGDKQAYSQFLDELDQEMALGSWLFSLPSLAYFSTQFYDESIALYGVASQLSTIEKWQESPKKGLFNF